MNTCHSPQNECSSVRLFPLYPSFPFFLLFPPAFSFFSFWIAKYLSIFLPFIFFYVVLTLRTCILLATDGVPCVSGVTAHF